MSRPITAVLLRVACAALFVSATGCGPTMLEKRIIEKPDPALLRPGPSAEEQSGEMPLLLDLQPTRPLVPADHVAPSAPDDPRPLALIDAPETAPVLPPPPVAPKATAGSKDDRRDARRDDRRADPAPAVDEAAEEDAEDDDGLDEDGRPRRGGVRVNPR